MIYSPSVQDGKPRQATTCGRLATSPAARPFLVFALMMSSVGLSSQGYGNTSTDREMIPQTIQADSRELWSTLEILSAGRWIVYDSKPFFYYKFEKINDNTIKYAGLDNDGNVIAGNFIRDPSFGSISHFAVRKGVVSEHMISKESDSLLLLGSEGGARVGQRLSREGLGQFRVDYIEFRKGTWLVVRSARYRAVSDDEIEALGWIKRNPEFEAQAESERRAAMASNPSFGRRLLAALQEGAVEGVRDGVDNRVRKAIGGK